MTTATKTAAVLFALTLLTASCTRVIDAQPVAGPDLAGGAGGGAAAQCEEVDAPLTDIETQVAGEPILRIPQPQGWTRNTMLDSELIRFAMSNPALGTDEFAPTAVVTLETAEGHQDPEQVFENQREALATGLGATGIASESHTLCGLPAETIRYQMPQMGGLEPHPAMVVGAVLHTESKTFVAAVTVQTTDPDNPDYQRDAETILTGFQILPPAKG
ncbi:LpqN/LpqT family lipoprotein [Mycolicibacterium goodii]|uniref:LpqN/LpqT family lipoprotein n=1 Tax=Mycolicibacterium goodii TaxID=134601 RepID=UPI001BDCD545|nr:LpqN/LpqT family lipoprotein [Mycolicibacterium goodii]MBU8809074.1 LpqN/LpqT family lipoprotein [Mycolicibacterium goodii]